MHISAMYNEIKIKHSLHFMQ